MREGDGLKGKSYHSDISDERLELLRNFTDALNATNNKQGVTFNKDMLVVKPKASLKAILKRRALR